MSNSEDDRRGGVAGLWIGLRSAGDFVAGWGEQRNDTLALVPPQAACGFAEDSETML
ncbi:MAG: hypothetical protein K8U57_26925 [Planctomycetes bacterium]|nr:hypothetical protein [Planctomycetota bacterium]